MDRRRFRRPIDFPVELRQNYTLGNVIGKGSYGIVLKGVHKITRCTVAIKILQRQQRARTEVKVMNLLAHPHIVRLYDFMASNTDIFVVMEYVGGGDLDYYLTDELTKTGTCLREDVARHVLQQIVSAVEYCHNLKVVHRDLKPENIMIADRERMLVKIVDFGLSDLMRDGQFFKETCGTIAYMAPEVLRRDYYAGPEVDVWSCGVILYGMLWSRVPFMSENITLLHDQMMRGEYDRPPHVSPEALNLLELMLAGDPVKRITIPKIRQHPWFRPCMPRYLALVPPSAAELGRLVAEQNASGVTCNEDIVQQVVSKRIIVRDGIIDRERLLVSLRKRLYNQGVVSYYILLQDQQRIQHDYLKSEFKDSELVGHMAPLTTPLLRCDTVGHWGLGAQFKGHPVQVMTLVKRTLQHAGISWKLIGRAHDYCLQCQCVYSTPHHHENHSLHPPIEPSIAAGLGTTSMGTEVNEVVKSNMGENKAVIKFKIQLYKASVDTYQVNLERLDGPAFLFFEISAQIYQAMGAV